MIDDIVTADVFAAAKTLRERNTFIREDGNALQYTLVNIEDWEIYSKIKRDVAV